ncbi:MULTISPECIES: FecR family protein [unclassified Devosia]|uniref:FecR family protein n=1 Tax=unclassified Devosia TaxID=196773 RepID=UPI000868A55A|nr:MULTISPECIES: FecR family protein [unclassified Devosia]MBN9360088.1 FecR domain-containing protein [Devosia sp.]ODS86700.1 MAG: hypothetical protein ABS47_13580 [Devosia sp. SCN 66-27]OJX22142.1 MAG: hypothetical protein BGO83_14875 [Devosia sp. 66-14]
MSTFKGMAAAGLWVALTLTALPAMAASGTALGVNPQAEADTSGQSRVLTVGADIFIGDKVSTGAKGQVQIKFSDKTELVVGPNSSLLIEDYLLREDQSAGKLAINALSGTFRFATGGAPKDRYVIKTPTGTIGVRGTAFDFNVDAEGTEVLLFHGAVRLCNLAGTCVTLDDTCEIGTYDLTQSTILGDPADLTKDQRAALKANFKYAEVQSPLLRQFWVENARQCFNKGFVNDTPRSLMDGDDDTPAVEQPCGDNGCCGDSNCCGEDDSECAN